LFFITSVNYLNYPVQPQNVSSNRENINSYFRNTIYLEYNPLFQLRLDPTSRGLTSY